MRRSLFALAASTALFAACGDEETPAPNEPAVVTAEAKCRKVGTESTYELNEIRVVVEDADGAEDLLDTEAGASVSVLVISARLQPTAAAEGEERVVYTWQKQASEEPIYCGDDGKLLEVRFEATDTDGFPASALIRSRPL